MAKNPSFIDVNEQLASLNVVNRWFFLDTLNPEVKDIDPFSKSLDGDAINAIIDECKKNIWYFLRHIVKTKDSNGAPVSYKLDLSKLASIYCSINNISNHPVALTQQGMMESTAALILWEILFKKDYKKIILNDVYEYGEELYFTICDIVELLPLYLKDKLVCNVDDRSIYSDGIQKLFPSSYPLTKKNIVNIINENNGNISIYPNFENMDINTDLIKRENLTTKAYSILPSYIVSDNSIHKTDVNLFVKSSLRWDEVFFDLDIDTFKSYLKRNSLTNFVYIQYKYEELGYSREYMREHNLSNPDFTRLSKPDIVQAEKAREEAERLREIEISKLINMNVTAELLPPDSNIDVKKTVDDDSIDLHFYIPRGKGSEGFSYDDLTDEEKEELLKGSYTREVIDSMFERLQYYGDMSVLPYEDLWEIEVSDDSTATLVSYSGFDSDVVIPYSVDGYTVTRVSDYIFDGYEYMNTIIIPSCITHIGAGMFSPFKGLTELRLPNGVVEIGENAFNGCESLTTLYIPNTVVSIGANAIPDTVKLIIESKGSVGEKYAIDNNIPFVYDTIDVITLDDSTPVNKTYLEARLDDALDGGEI